MVNITWYYARTGPGQVAEIASYTAPVQAKLKAEASKRQRRAQSLLDSLPKVRTGDSQVTLSRGDLDYYVQIEDPSGKGGAAGIEDMFGILGSVF